MEAFTAVFAEEGEWVIGWVEELPGAVARERSLDEARESLREALRDVLSANGNWHARLGRDKSSCGSQ